MVTVTHVGTDSFPLCFNCGTSDNRKDECSGCRAERMRDERDERNADRDDSYYERY